MFGSMVCWMAMLRDHATVLFDIHKTRFHLKNSIFLGNMFDLTYNISETHKYVNTCCIDCYDGANIPKKHQKMPNQPKSNIANLTFFNSFDGSMLKKLKKSWFMSMLCGCQHIMFRINSISTEIPCIMYANCVWQTTNSNDPCKSWVDESRHQRQQT